MRSETDSASFWSWVTYTVVNANSLHTRLISARISNRSFASKFDSGSSRSRHRGRTTSARASATRCCCPPESWLGLRSAYDPIRTDSNASPTRRLSSSRATFLSSRPNATFSATVMCGQRA